MLGSQDGRWEFNSRRVIFMLKNVKVNSATFAGHNLISNYVFKGKYIKID